jgi:hypothetical protein
MGNQPVFLIRNTPLALSLKSIHNPSPYWFLFFNFTESYNFCQVNRTAAEAQTSLRQSGGVLDPTGSIKKVKYKNISLFHLSITLFINYTVSIHAFPASG